MDSSITVFSLEDPMLYPPTLNAVAHLCESYDRVYLVSTFISKSEWHFPKNIKLFSGSGSASNMNRIKKLFIILKMLTSLVVACRNSKVILIYDGMSLYYFGLIKRFIGKTKIWYHNHDVFEPSGSSISILLKKAMRYEKKAFSYLDFFTLPSMERLQYFEMDKLKGHFAFLPNYPDSNFYTKVDFKKKRKNQSIKIIYQGRISQSHGFEEVIPFLIENTNIIMTLIGPVNEDYLEKLNILIQESNLKKQLTILPSVSYEKLRKITLSHDIGWAVNIPNKLIYKTGGTASNKIYEYAACGLPIIYYDYEAYNKHLSCYEWARKTDLTRSSLSKIILELNDEYSYLSNQAYSDFINNFNYKTYFNEVHDKLIDHA